MKLSEKLGFVLIFVIIALGLWLSHFRPEDYISWYAGRHGILEWLTLASIVSGFIATLYRASILGPFRRTSFVIGLYSTASLILVIGILEGSRRWGLLQDFIPSWFVSSLFFSYLVILPLCYLKFPKVRRRIDNWAIPMPRAYHINLYAALLMIHFLTSALEQRPEQLQFGAAWLFFMVMMEPLNRVIFSRKTLER